MAQHWFSDNLGDAANQIIADPAYNASYRRDSSKTHARKRIKRMESATGAIIPITDTLVMGTFKSGDRLYDLRLSTDTLAGAAGLLDCGLYKAALDHIPVAANLINVDMFANGDDVFTAILDREDWFVQSTQLEDFERGLTLWELVNIADAATTYSVDPMEDWDMVITASTATDAARIYTLEAEYVAAG